MSFHLLTGAARRRGFRPSGVSLPPPPAGGPPGSDPYTRFFDDGNGGTTGVFPGIDPELLRHSPTLVIEQPRRKLDTKAPDTTGWDEYVVNDMAEFNAATASIGAGNGVILLAPAFSEANATIPARPFDGSGVRPASRIVVRPQTPPAGFPAEGVRIGPTVGEQLPSFRASSNNTPALYMMSAGESKYVYGWWMTGVRFYQSAAINQMGLVVLGRQWESSQGYQGDQRFLAHDIVFDRCYGVGPADKTGARYDDFCRRCFSMQGSHMGVLDSWVWKFTDHSTDSQAVWYRGGPGPMAVVNNFLQGAAEPFMAGGTYNYNPDGDGATYCADLEFRLNHTHRPQRWNRHHPAFAREAEVLRSGMTVGAYDSATRTVTLSSGTFDTALLESGTYLKILAVIVGGPRDGSWAHISTYPNATSATVQSHQDSDRGRGLWKLGAPEPGDAIEIRRAVAWICKNTFEIKHCKRALVLANVLENAWHGDGQQPDAVNVKAGDPNGDGGVTRDVVFWDNIVTNVYGGLLFTSKADADASYGAFYDVVNNLVIAQPDRRFVGRQSSTSQDNNYMPLRLGADYTRIRQLTGVYPPAGGEYTRSVAFDGGGYGSANQGPNEGVLDGLIFADVLFRWRQWGIYQFNSFNNVSGIVAEDVIWGTVGAYGRTGSMYAPAWPSPDTVDVAATDVWKNPTYDFWGDADWSVDEVAFPELAGVGVDWARIQQRTAGVRASEALIPQEWT